MIALAQYLNNLVEDPAILRIASLCLAVQMLFTVAIMFLPYQGPWKATGSFSAHQILV